LYQEGYISYPRTETAAFAEDFDLHSLIQAQTSHPRWGPYAHSLLQPAAEGTTGGFMRPRKGKGDDQSHPPIHPIKEGQSLTGNEARVYEFVVRHFLACCSKDGLVCSQ
jgi:DNA topoisomerase-3